MRSASLCRSLFAAALVASLAEGGEAAGRRGHVIVEHTSINPNKAAHIGHIRNACLGDTFVRLLRHQQGRGLGQVAVEQFIEFVANVEPGQRGSRQPDDDHASEHPGDEAALQRTRALPRHRHQPVAEPLAVSM